MKTIKLLGSTVCGGERVKKGQVVEASDKDAFYLIHSGAAVACDPEKESEKKAPAKKKAPANKAVEVDTIETR
jgi:hypothetical protein